MTQSKSKSVIGFLLSVQFCLLTFGSVAQSTQHSVAREWNEALLHAITYDFARPTVHARNLWHTSFAMYDAWAVYNNSAECFFLGKTVGGFTCEFDGITPTGNLRDAQNEAISFAAFRLLKHRFQNSPRKAPTFNYIDSLFADLGYDSSFVSTDYSSGSPAALGNYLASKIIEFGLQDSANEANSYANQFYETVNPPLVMAISGNPDIVDPNRWQPLTLDVYIDQSGNIIPGGTAKCLSPEWGEVTPFALKNEDLTVHYRDGNQYKVYHDPGPPPFIDTANGGAESELFKWTFTMVAKWASHLDTADNVMWDISPASIGNIPWYPSTLDSIQYFYDYENGGDNGLGHTLNPVTGQPYTPQIVHRGDYTRVLAEFWADGPNSVTPPGHWFDILNYVSDHELHENRWSGDGPIRDNLEWDVKSYFTLGGTMHDAAISCWGIKGWYDYIRPVSAFRFMADQGQSSDPNLPNYSINGLPLEPGFIEIVDSADAIAGALYQNVGKIKVRTWMGPDFVLEPATDMAGVDWILAENWWSYQRPSFVSPPFPGYMSGHSTYSRAAAEVMEAITGNAYFPGGMGEFVAKKNEFLFFEEGPSQDIKLQWATYRDASDQCSLSRIWGGIHPGVDDIPGRWIGVEISEDAFNKAITYWEDDTTDLILVAANERHISKDLVGQSAFSIKCVFDREMDTTSTPLITFPAENPTVNTLTPNSTLTGWADIYTYIAYYDVADNGEVLLDVDVSVTGGLDLSGYEPEGLVMVDEFDIDMIIPEVLSVVASQDTVKREQAGQGGFLLSIHFNEPMHRRTHPLISFSTDVTSSLTYEFGRWVNPQTFEASYSVSANSNKIDDITVFVSEGKDEAGNKHLSYTEPSLFSINVYPPLGVSSMISGSNLYLFPNPVKRGNIIYVPINNDQERTVSVSDLLGRTVYSIEIDNQQIVGIPTDQLSLGEYIITTSGSSIQRKAKMIIIE